MRKKRDSVRRFFIVALMLTVVCGQTTAAVWKGRVLDEQGEALPYANVVLMSVRDSAMIAGTTTDTEGAYQIDGDASGAQVAITMVGYKTVYVDNPDGGTIRMELDVEALGEVTITAILPKTTITDQGLQTLVQGTVLETAGTANDALSRVPGLIKGQDGLEVLGKGAPLVYINGRKVTDSKELDRLQSNEIQNVEVITNPGAQYDATVRSVVRIKTVRHQGDGFGFNAGFEDAQSLRNGYNDPSGYLNMNFRHNGLDFFVGGNGLKFTSRQQSNLLQQTFGNPGFLQQGTLDFVQTMSNFGVNGGLNCQIDDNHSTGVRVEYDADPYLKSEQVIDEEAYRGNTLVDKLLSEGKNKIDNMPWSLKANAYYNGTVGKLGIDFNADYLRMKSSDQANTRESSTVTSDDEVSYITHSSNSMYAAKLVLSYPILIGALQVGNEDVFSRRSDDYVIDKSNVPSSASEVAEDNVALFASYGFYLPKFGQLSAGVRYEHVDYSYDDIYGNDDLTRKYDNFFPTLSYANAFGPVQLQLSYGSKTIRPDFYSLSSAVRYHSRYILQSGNSRLQPQTTNDLGLTVNWNFLTMVAQYSRVDDAITSWSELYNSDGIVLVHPVNLDRPMRTLAWFVNASPTIGVWTMNYTVGVQQQWLSLDCPDVREPDGIRSVSFSDKPMWIAQLFNTFRLRHNWQIELGCEYHSKAYSQNSMLTNVFFNLTAAVQKSFLEGALVVRLSGEDLAGKANYDVMIDCGSHIIDQTNIMDSQRLKLSVRYNFNTATSKYKGTGAGQDAARRMSK